MAELFRILGLVTASIEGKLPSEQIDEDTRIIRVQELLVFTESAPLDLLCRPATFPTYSYILNVLANISVGKESPKIRITAAHSLEGILNCHPSDEFVGKVMPGLCTILLKFLPSWEKEPFEVVKSCLRSLGSILERRYKLAQQQAKLGIVLERLYLLASSFVRNKVVTAAYVELLRRILTKLAQEDKAYDEHLGTLLRGLAIVASFPRESPPIHIHTLTVDEEMRSRLLSIAVKLLQDGLESLAEGAIENISFSHLDLLCGFCRMTQNQSFWGANFGPLVLETATRLIPRSRLVASLRNTSTIVDGRWAWGSAEVATSMGELLAVAADVLIPQIVASPSLETELILCLGQCLKGSVGDIEDLVGFLVDTIDTFWGRDLALEGFTTLEGLADEEEFWACAWCSCVWSLLGNCTSPLTVLDYLCRPLLMLAGSARASSPSSRCAASLLCDLARLQTGGGSTRDYLQSHASTLLTVIAADLRYPAIYPRAPLMLSHFLRMLHPAKGPLVIRVLDIVREIEDRASELQHQPGYSLTLLECMEECIKLATGSSTSPPQNKSPFRQSLTVENIDDPSSHTPEEESHDLERTKSLEEELASLIISVAINFLTNDEVPIRIAAIRLLSETVTVFVETRESGPPPFLPLAHQMWKPLLCRISTDPSLDVTRQALSLIAKQCQIAGEFLADRIQKELLPTMGSVLCRETSLANPHSTIAPDIISIIQQMGRASGRTIRGALMAVLGVCGRTMSPPETVKLISALAAVDPDQVWFVLAVQLGGVVGTNGQLAHPRGTDNYPTINLHKFQKDISAWGEAQRKVVSLALAQLYQA